MAIVALVAVLAAGLFTGAALYITFRRGMRRCDAQVGRVLLGDARGRAER